MGYLKLTFLIRKNEKCMIFALSVKKQCNLSARIICSVILYLKLTISVVCIPSNNLLGYFILETNN